MSSCIIRNTLLALSLAALAGTPVHAANVSTDYDHNADFRSYHTFSFYKVQTADPLFEQRIKDEVTKDLTQAGWQPVENGGDVSITAIGNVHDKQEYNTFYDGLGGGGWGWRGWGGWGGRWGTAETTVETVPVGTLMLDMYDKNTHQLIWRGRSTSDLSSKSDKNTKTLDKDIDKMLNGFPPKSKG
jgi:Domain of unknown function (DUF4136)